ncbi:MAG: hypothetical protein EB116_19205 [Betaproteobacteria bacterium]|nr:hypothetical protein [Betaproteobacteria bacterium]
MLVHPLPYDGLLSSEGLQAVLELALSTGGCFDAALIALLLGELEDLVAFALAAAAHTVAVAIAVTLPESIATTLTAGLADLSVGHDGWRIEDGAKVVFKFDHHVVSPLLTAKLL